MILSLCPLGGDVAFLKKESFMTAFLYPSVLITKVSTPKKGRRAKKLQEAVRLADSEWSVRKNGLHFGHAMQICSVR